MRVVGVEAVRVDRRLGLADWRSEDLEYMYSTTG